MIQFFNKGIIKQIEKKYKISLDKDAQDNQILSSFGFFDSRALLSVLDTIKEADHTLLDPNDKGPTTVKTVIYLTKKYSPQSLSKVFSALEKGKLVNPEMFTKFTNLLDNFNRKEACESCIEIFDYFTWQTSSLAPLLTLANKSDNAIIMLQKIMMKLPLLYLYSNDKSLLHLDEASLETTLVTINNLSEAKLLSSKYLSVVLPKKERFLSQKFCSPQSLKVNYQLFFAFKESNLLTQYNLEKLQSLRSLVEYKLPDNLKEALKNSSQLVMPISNFIPLIIELSHQKRLNQSLLDEIISEVKDALIDPSTPVEVLAQQKKGITHLEAYTIKEKINMVNAFFEGTKMTIALEKQRINEDIAPPPYEAHDTFWHKR